MSEADTPSSPATTRTTCPYCGVGCGVLATPREDGVLIEGDPDHPANFGRLCSKGAALAETLGDEERILTPEVGGRAASWDEALGLVADRFKSTIAEHGPDSVAFYVSGQLLTEDYYVANKLMKGFIGSANIDTNSRLCMASSVAGHKRAFGADTVPGVYSDLEEADLVILTGSNLAWCHPVLYQRLLAARERRGTKLVVIDPRATASSESADLHLPIRPGADVALFNGLLAHLIRSERVDHAFVEQHTDGFMEAAAGVDDSTPVRTAASCGLDPRDVGQFFQWFGDTERVVTVYSQGVNQSSSGTDKVNAIINCHLATGRIGKPGAGPFSVTGQPNAMGGREVGGLANQLAAHMDIADGAARARVQRFWNAPTIAESPGLKAVDLFDAVADGRVKALWVMATNPAVSLPNADQVARAIADCPFLVVSDVTNTTETAKLADVLLPATAWGEKTGTVTNSERVISRQRPFRSAPGEARHDWAIIADVAQRMGFPGFDYPDAASVFREHAALSGFENNGARDFDISAYASADDASYNALEPFRWPAPAETQTPVDPAGRFFGAGGFYTTDGKARFVPTAHRAPANAPDADYPLRLNTGRIRDHWHTMTRTGLAARLSEHIGEPFVEVHPDDADAAGLTPASIAKLESRWGSMLARVVVTDRQAKGGLFAPMHWTARYASAGRADALVNPAVDPISGQPELKHTPVRVSPFAARWYGFLVSRRELDAPFADYWARARAKDGWRMELAGSGAFEDIVDAPERLMGAHGDECEIISYVDARRGRRRLAVVRDGRLEACLFLAREPLAVDRSWIAELLSEGELTSEHRLGLLAGRDLGGATRGRLVCACNGVGETAICDAARGGAIDVDAIGRRTRAGTTCGSCKPEIARIVLNLLQGSAA